MIWLLLLTALAVGMLFPIQAGVNAELRTLVGHPMPAAIIQFLVGLVALIAVAVVMRAPLPAVSRLTSAPLWVYIGGLCGASYILISLALAPRVGAATLIGVSVAGQMLASLILDHFGLVGYPMHPVSPWRLAGAGLMLLGVALIQRF